MGRIYEYVIIYEISKHVNIESVICNDMKIE